MAVGVHDAAQQANSGGSAAVTLSNYTVTEGAEILLGLVQYSSNGRRDCNGVTFDGQALTWLNGQVGGDSYKSTQIYYMLNPTPKTANGYTSYGGYIGSQSVTLSMFTLSGGVDTDLGFLNSSHRACATGTNPSWSVTSTEGNVVISVYSTGGTHDDPADWTIIGASDSRLLGDSTEGTTQTSYTAGNNWWCWTMGELAQVQSGPGHRTMTTTGAG